MPRYWDRGNRDEWNALSRNHRRERPPEQKAVADAAIAACKAALAEVIEADGGKVPRETCAELGHKWVESELLLHTLQCTRCNTLIENPKRTEAQRAHET